MEVFDGLKERFITDNDLESLKEKYTNLQAYYHRIEFEITKEERAYWMRDTIDAIDRHLDKHIREQRERLFPPKEKDGLK